MIDQRRMVMFLVYWMARELACMSLLLLHVHSSGHVLEATEQAKP